MRFVDHRWLAFGTIVHRMVFFFFQENVSKKLQNALIGILEVFLSFETFMLDRNQFGHDDKRRRFLTSNRPSTGLNMKPFFTVSAVNSS